MVNTHGKGGCEVEGRRPEQRSRSRRLSIGLMESGRPLEAVRAADAAQAQVETAEPLRQLMSVIMMRFVLVKGVKMMSLLAVLTSQAAIGQALRTHATRTLSVTAEDWTWKSRPIVTEQVGGTVALPPGACQRRGARAAAWIGSSRSLPVKLGQPSASVAVGGVGGPPP